MRLALAVPLIFVVVFGDKSCDIDLGDIGDFVVQYEIVVENKGPEEALISIGGADINAGAIVPAGGSVSANSYQGGTVTVVAQPSVDRRAELQSRKVDIETQLAARPLNLSQATLLSQELDAITAQLKQPPTSQAGACFTRLQPDEKGKGTEVDLEANKTDAGWTVTGFCSF